MCPLLAGDNLRQLYDRWRTDWPTPRRLLDFWRDALVDDELERMLGPTDTVRIHTFAKILLSYNFSET
jgi:hypothetical protein